MSERAPYSRVYWSVIDDEKFVDIYDDDRALACWLRLLLVADQAWPASASVPVTARKSALDKLSASGLIDRKPGGRFRVHGLDAERGKRAASATRQGPKRDPVGTQLPSALRATDETRRDEQSRDDAREDLEAFLAVRFRPPTPAQRTFMDGYCRTFDATGPARAARLIFANPDDPIGAMKSDLAEFRAQRRTEAIKSEPPKPTRRASGLTGINAELAAMYRDQYAEEAAE